MMRTTIFILTLASAMAAQAQDTSPMIVSPEGGNVTVGQTLPLVVTPLSAVVRVSGPARVVGGKLRVTGPGLIAVMAVASAQTSAPVWLISGSIANAPLGMRPLARGDSGSDVKALQELLDNVLGPPGSQPVTPDGMFGPKTQAAIRAFQRGHGLSPTGTADSATQDALAAAPTGDAPAPAIDDPGVSLDGSRTSGPSYRTGWSGGRTSAHVLKGGDIALSGGMNIDADGAGSAWRTDPSGQPRTSLMDGHGRSLDPTRTPYVVLPIGFEKAHPGVKLGDIVAVQYNGKTVFAIYGDRGPRTKFGEASILTAEMLGINGSPTHGGVGSGVTYIVFPGSGSGAPLSNDEIARRGKAALDKLEGRAAPDPSPGLTGALNKNP